MEVWLLGWFIVGEGVDFLSRLLPVVGETPMIIYGLATICLCIQCFTTESILMLIFLSLVLVMFTSLL